MKIYSRYLEMTTNYHPELTENCCKSIKKRLNKNTLKMQGNKTKFTEEKSARANEYMKMFIIISKQRKEN